MTQASREYHRPWTHPALDAAGFAELLTRAAREDVEALVARPVDGTAITGVFVLSQIFHHSFHSAYLGYYGSALHAHQGYMSAGLRLTLDPRVRPGRAAPRRGEHPAGQRRVACARGPPRLPPRGFSPRYLKIAGRWRDHERWALLADEWADLRLRLPTPAGAGGAAPSA